MNLIIKSNKVLRQKPFKTEKELQTYVEQNMKTILQLEFIETEFPVGDFRIDTLAYDKESKAFIIIEYKNVKNHSLIDQGVTYLNLMYDKEADFVLKYNQKTKSSLTQKDFDWTQSRVIFISNTYTPYQLNATSKNLPFDLIKLTRYEDDIIDVEFIEKKRKDKTR